MRASRLAASVVASLCLAALAVPAGANQPAASAGAANPPLTDVPEYRANASRTGEYTGPGPVDDPVQVWSRTIDASIEFNPILADGMLLFGGADSTLHALDGRTGAERWRFEAADAFNRFGSAASGIVAVASADGIIHALDLETGRERWSRPGIGMGTDIVDGVVYVPGIDDHAYGLDLATGEEVWAWAAPAAVAYLTVADGTAYASVGDGRLYAISIVDNAEQWHVQTLAANPGVAEIMGDAVYVSGEVGGGSGGELYAIDRASGAVRWRFRTASGNQITLGAVADGVLYAGTLDRSGLFAFPTTGDASGSAPQPLWHTPSESAAYKNQALSGDLLYVPVSDPSEVLAIRAADGEVRWRLTIGGTPNGILVSGGMLFVADESGTITAYAEPELAATIGPVNSGALTATSGPALPPNPFTIVSTLRPATTGLATIVDFAVGPDGLLYVLDMKPSVTVIDPATGSVVRSWGRTGTGEGEFDLARSDEPWGIGAIDVGVDGLVYVGDGGNHRYQVFHPDGTFVRQAGAFGAAEGQFLQISNIEVDADGNVYTVDDYHTVSKFDRNGRFLWRVGRGARADRQLPGEYLHEVRVRADGRVFLGVEDGTVVELDPATGAVLDSWGEPGEGPGGLSGLCGLDFDSNDNAYIYGCGLVRLQVFDASHRLVAGSYPPRDPQLGPVRSGPHGEVYSVPNIDSAVTTSIQLLVVDLPKGRTHP